MWIIIQKKWPIWYFDATGSICKKIENQKLPYLYSIVAHDYESKNIIPISEFLTTSHTQMNISLNLMQIKNFFLKYSSLSGKKFGFQYPIAPIIVTDFSWPLINSVLDIFNNNMTIIKYLELAYEILVKKEKHKLTLINTFIYLCSIHYLKTFIKNTKKIHHQDKKNEIRVKKSLIFCFTLLQNATSLEEIEFLLENIYNVFNIKKRNQSFISSICLIENRLKNRNLDQDFFYDESEKDRQRYQSKMELNSKSNLIYTKRQLKGLKNSSPFKKYFEKIIYSNFKNKISQEYSKENLEENIFYNPALFTLIYDVMYLLPLWSGVLINLFSKNSELNIEDIKRLENNSVEGWFDILKNKIVVKSSVMPSEIASLTYERLRFKFNLYYKPKLNEISPRLTALDETEIKVKKKAFWTEAEENSSRKLKKDFHSNEELEQWKPKKTKRHKANFYSHDSYFNASESDLKIHKINDFVNVFCGKSFFFRFSDRKRTVNVCKKLSDSKLFTFKIFFGILGKKNRF
jgi:hypothetical protein